MSVLAVASAARLILVLFVFAVSTVDVLVAKAVCAANAVANATVQLTTFFYFDHNFARFINEKYIANV